MAGPWYGIVTADTRGLWASAFFNNENLRRFSTPMENHQGPFFYHAVVLLVLFTPWSVFLLAAVWYGVKGTRSAEPNPPTPFPEKEGGGKPLTSIFSPSPLGGGAASEVGLSSPRPHRFLICWFAVYLVFFSAAATKLPNYMLPVYPALAILTSRFLVRWRTGDITLPKWLMPAAIAGLVLTAVVVGSGMLVAGDTLKVLPDGARVFPGLGRWAVLAVIPLASAFVMMRAMRADDRGRFLRAMTIGAVAFTTLAAAIPPLNVDTQKAAKELVRESGVADPSRDLRLAHFDWFQPSVVFYAHREVADIPSPDKAVEFLTVPTPAYLFIPAKTWEALVEAKVTVPVRIVARHHDFYRNCEILVVTNDTTATAGR